MKIKVRLTKQYNLNYYNAQLNDVIEVEFEEYVAAVTATEIGNSHIEACKAQAIAARSFAISRGVLRGLTISDSSSNAQAYSAKRYNEKTYPNCLQAARETESVVLIYQNKVINSIYTASNGGRTVSCHERWGGTDYPFLPAQDDPWDAAAGYALAGTGVGMSQRGAIYAAKKGIDYKSILSFYYPGTTLEKNYGKIGVVVMSKVTDKVVELAKSLEGSPYVWGATGEKCTVANRQSRMKSSKLTTVSRENIKNRCPVLSGKQKTCAGCKYEGMDEYDCIGYVNYVNKTCGIYLNGAGATYHYENKSNFVCQGDIKDMPNVVCCVYQRKDNRMQHIGFHIGNGEIIHCSGSGEVKYGNTNDKNWTHYAIPRGYYTEEELKEAGVMSSMITATILKKGMRGEEVLQLQMILNKLGYDCGEADGIFGKKTVAGVTAFQADHGLKEDGIAGPITLGLIEKLISAEPELVTESEPDTEPEKETDSEPIENLFHVEDLKKEALQIKSELSLLINRVDAFSEELDSFLNK